MSCPGMGCARNDACPEGSLCVDVPRLILSVIGLSLSQNSKTWKREEWGPRPTDSISVHEPKASFVPHNVS